MLTKIILSGKFLGVIYLPAPATSFEILPDRIQSRGHGVSRAKRVLLAVLRSHILDIGCDFRQTCVLCFSKLYWDYTVLLGQNTTLSHRRRGHGPVWVFVRYFVQGKKIRLSFSKQSLYWLIVTGLHTVFYQVYEVSDSLEQASLTWS